ncbi:MAG: D-alanine--D-alanine ligase [Patescibacteria group bacterium]
MYFTLPSSLRIGVVRGGPSPEYDVSLKTGSNVLKELSVTHRPIDIFISRDGTWHMRGVPKTPDRILKHVDVVFNALHGTYGEDGRIQEIFDHYGIPYSGSGKLSSAISMNKFMTKECITQAGIKTPLSVLVRTTDNVPTSIRNVFSLLPMPVIIKPVTGGSSVGITIAHTKEELVDAIETILQSENDVLVEEYIKGREATCGVVNNMRGQNVYALPVVEIIPPKKSDEPNQFFDYDAKYSGQSREICPGNFSIAEKKEIERISSEVHSILSLDGYSRSDFIVTPRRGIYFLEVNTLPGLTSESLLPKSLEAVGIKFQEFLHHILGLALERK